MNRHVRRANEKSDKKKEKEKDRRKRERRSARTQRSNKRAEKAARKPAVKPGNRTSRTGRFAGVLAAFVIAFILFNELSPAFLESEAQALSGWADILFETVYFALLGYFGCLWLLRRGLMRALPVTVAVGLGLAVFIAGAKLVLPELEPTYLTLALALPALLGGAFLGRLVYQKAV